MPGSRHTARGPARPEPCAISSAAHCDCSAVHGRGPAGAVRRTGSSGARTPTSRLGGHRHRPHRSVAEPVVQRRRPGRRWCRGRRARRRRGGPRPSRGRARRSPVSARPSPGTGRKTSCWCSWAVPPLMAPPTRLASRASSSRGPRTRRASDARRRSPGPAARSGPASGRRSARSRRGPRPRGCRRRRRRRRPPAGTCV